MRCFVLSFGYENVAIVGRAVARSDTLAQASMSCLGETCRSRPVSHSNSRLGRELLFWARYYLAHARDAHLSENAWWCDPNKAYSLGQRLGPNHAQGPIHGPHAPSSPSPSRGPITRSMLKKIQDGPNSHRLLVLFTWAKEDVKIWRGVSKSNRIAIILAHCLGFAFQNNKSNNE